MIPPAQQDFCKHDFTMGFCPHNCMKYYYHQDFVRAERAAFMKLFKRKRGEKNFWRNPITKRSIVLKLQQFYRAEQYVQQPGNIVIPGYKEAII